MPTGAWDIMKLSREVVMFRFAPAALALALLDTSAPVHDRRSRASRPGRPTISILGNGPLEHDAVQADGLSLGVL